MVNESSTTRPLSLSELSTEYRMSNNYTNVTSQRAAPIVKGRLIRYSSQNLQQTYELTGTLIPHFMLACSMQDVRWCGLVEGRVWLYVVCLHIHLPRTKPEITYWYKEKIFIYVVVVAVYTMHDYVNISRFTSWFCRRHEQIAVVRTERKLAIAKQ
jgi:hypothetical protein